MQDPRPSSPAPSTSRHLARPKQKRNKPTLSCNICVEHKTKCDRVRPQCLACLKRSSRCEYSQVANPLAASEKRIGGSPRPSRATEHADLTKCSIANVTHPTQVRQATHLSAIADLIHAQDDNPAPSRPVAQHASTSFSTMRSRKISSSSADSVPVSIFAVGVEHPFTNYWTAKGGLAEVIDVLPSKEQADILIAKFFEMIDPLLPILDRAVFLEDYNGFWALSYHDKCNSSAVVVALHFVLYAIATEYIELPRRGERPKTAQFYVSAGHQALRLGSYLTRVSVMTVQTMILMFYYLGSSNNISDGWTFSGITQRQAYVLQLHRDPYVVAPFASVAEKNVRCKLWAIMLYQETGIGMELNFPSTSLQSDVGPHSLNYDEVDSRPELKTVEHPIATLHPELVRTDISYCKSIWAYSTFCQEHICGPRALGQPLCRSYEHRRELLSAARSLYRSFPHPFGSYDPARFWNGSRRAARQQTALTQCFFHVVMWICVDENPQADVVADFYGTLEAAHQALEGFFALYAVFDDETVTWWTFLHRAFEEAILVADLLAAGPKTKYASVPSNGTTNEYNLVSAAKDDVRRILEVLRRSDGSPESQGLRRRRLDSLQAVYDRITFDHREPP